MKETQLPSPRILFKNPVERKKKKEKKTHLTGVLFLFRKIKQSGN
jgi:hypothetical protein